MDAGPTTDGAAATDRRREPSWLAVPALTLVLALAAACTVTSGPGTETVRGILSIGPDGTDTAATAASDLAEAGVLHGSLEVPDTVRVGESFTADVRTVGRNGCWSAAGEDVSVEGLAATVVPFDATGQQEGVGCTTALVSLRHEPTLRFDRAGEATVRVEGRRIIESGESESEPMSLEATVTVVP